MYDVVIVGSRCAGAATAATLGRRGHRVLLLDRGDLTEGTLSTHVFGDWEALERLGVAAEVAAAGAPRLTRFRIEIQGCALEAGSVVTPWASGLRREKLDPILLRRACAWPGVEWWPHTPVTDLLWADGQVAGVLAARDGGPPVPVRARVVVGADGRHSPVARRVQAAAYLEAPEYRCCYYAYFRGVAPLPLPAFEFYWWDDDILIAFPCDDDLHCLVVMPPQAQFSAWRRQPAARLEERLRQVPTLAPRLRGARRAGPVQGAGDLRSFLRQCYGPGWALVGDAGGSIHPCVGAGIDNAVAGGALLGDALHEFLSGRRDWTDAMAAYQEARDMRVRPALESAARLASAPLPDGRALAWFRLLCTLPGVALRLARAGESIFSHLLGPEAVAAMEEVISPLAAAGRFQT